jgi:8-amino-7-oxononanoate synthase
LSLTSFGLSARLSKLRAQSRIRALSPIEFSSSTQIRASGKDYLNFSSNDYLGLAADSRVAKSYIEGVNRFGSGSGASALVTGRSQAHSELEAALADHLGVEAVLLFGSGFLANLGVISALADAQTQVYSDALNHASIIDALKLSRAERHIYAHKSIDALEHQLLESKSKGNTVPRLIVSDHVFSMDGDKANVAGLRRLADAHDSALMIDDAHGFALPYEAKSSDCDVYVATLGKSLGLSGAFVAGSNDLIEFLVNHARTAIYSTALAPAIAHAAIRALKIIKERELGQKLLANIDYFKNQAIEYGLDLLPSDTAIQPMLLGSDEASLSAMQALKDKGLWVTAIRPPTVAEGTSRLRIVFSAAHSESQIDCLLAGLRSLKNN